MTATTALSSNIIVSVLTAANFFVYIATFSQIS